MSVGQKVIPYAPIIVANGRIANVAEHVLMLSLSDYFTAPRIRLCFDNPDALIYHLANDPMFVVMIFDGKNYEQICVLFETLRVSQPTITKVLAINESQTVLLGEDRDFGHDTMLRFSDNYMAEGLTVQFRNIFGPSEAELLSAVAVDHSTPTSVLSENWANIQREEGKGELHLIALRYPDLDQCMTAAQFQAIDDHYGKKALLSQPRFESYFPHLSDCPDCAAKLAKYPNFHAAGIKMITNDARLVFRETPGFQIREKEVKLPISIYDRKKEDQLGVREFIANY